ncbi:myo-inositol 2-dehydrogenase [Brachybacterium endophyticum]|uniref:Myo-inositol 2-dehydrogenase n=1 Tax=Brachybacterium endophyticum TaxID=2182385 RepID=A0A2U2RLB6_9MICO|nr:Gfo/Idh/MocA family oxidoreductase [Brachybacterium endophyticum]PWH06574.1 myo-inositol 2-dehydrogenase [Brachybacterium endophyticum]
MAALREVGVGVVGLGWMGRLHCSSYQRIPARFPELGLRPRLRVVADPSAAAQGAALEQFEAQRAVDDAAAVFSDPSVAAVSICSPNFLHRGLALAAAEAGKPFWIEKPMGVDAAQSREIHDAARAAGVATAVGFNYRHAPAVEHIRALVREGRLGRITNVRCRMDADYAASPDGPLTWRYDRERAGAGVIADLLSHGSDLVQYVTGQAITEVSATTDVLIRDRPIPTSTGVGHGSVEVGDERGPVGNEDWVAALATLDGGAHATLESSRVARGHRSDYVLEVFGTEGSARWTFTRMNEFEVMIGDGGLEHGYTTVFAGAGHGDYGRFQPGPGIPMSFDDLKAIECAQFLAGVVGDAGDGGLGDGVTGDGAGGLGVGAGALVAPTTADGLAAAEITDAIVRSAASRSWVEVPQVDGTTRAM